MRAGLLFYLLLQGLHVAAQVPSAAAADYPFLLRLQRREYGSNACVLLRREGEYHLEQEGRRSTAVFEGTLSPAQLAKVNQWLNEPTLQHFSQKDVVVPLISRNNDQIQINILRSDHWQWLEFPDAESRKPLAFSLDPLLQWLKNLPKLPARKLSEDQGKNNCLPPREIELKRRGEADSGKSPAAAHPESSPTEPHASFLLRFEVDRYGSGTAERECIVVYPDGRYHAEKSSQSGGANMATQVYEARLSEGKLGNVRELLEKPDLAGLHEGNLPQDAQAAEITVVWIPRAEGLQTLRFARNFSLWHAGRWNSVSNDPGARIAEPIQDWVRAELHPSRANQQKNVAGTNCVPR